MNKRKDKLIIIGIENYRKSNLTKVRYALNDVKEFKILLSNILSLAESEILLLTDENASKTALENDVKYFISTLGIDDRLILYYAGHGFYMKGHNWLTAWDSNIYNLEGTSISVDELIINPLKNSMCKESIIFIDSCSENIKELGSRSIFGSLSSEAFEKFKDSFTFLAIFLSCSPGEKSYSDDKLKHGIWTYYLLEALRNRKWIKYKTDSLITDEMLKNHLSISVINHLTNSRIEGIQTPYSIISSQSTVDLFKFKEELIFYKSSEEFEKLTQINDHDVKLITNSFRFMESSYSFFDISIEKKLIKIRLGKVIQFNNEYVKSRIELEEKLEKENGRELNHEELIPYYELKKSELAEKYELSENVWFGNEIQHIYKIQTKSWEKSLNWWIYGVLPSQPLATLMNELTEDHDLDEYYIFYGVPRKIINDGVYFEYLGGNIFTLANRKLTLD